jgi:predicted DNA-binding ribbon-helix-helix protein
MTNAPIKRSVTLAGHRTSISMEAEFWDALQEIAARRNHSVNGLISEIDAARPNSGAQAGGLSGAVRCYILAWYRGREG